MYSVSWVKSSPWSEEFSTVDSGKYNQKTGGKDPKDSRCYLTENKESLQDFLSRLAIKYKCYFSKTTWGWYTKDTIETREQWQENKTSSKHRELSKNIMKLDSSYSYNKRKLERFEKSLANNI